MITKPRTVLVLLGIFLAGLASGVFLAPMVQPLLRPPSHAHGARPSFAERTMQRLDEAVVFTPEQRVQVEALMRTTGDEMARLRRDAWTAGGEQIRLLNARIEKLLTPEQRAKFDTYTREQEERMRQRMAERDLRRGRRSGEEPPPPAGPGGEQPPPPVD